MKSGTETAAAGTQDAGRSPIHGVIGQRVKAVLVLLDDTERKLDEYKEGLAKIKSDRDTLAEKMRAKAEGEPYEGVEVKESLEELTRGWAGKVNAFELQDRMKKKCEKSANASGERFRALCLNAFGLDGTIPYQGKAVTDGHLRVLVADLVGGEILAKPYGELGIVDVADVLRLHRDGAFKKFVKGKNLTQGQASYLLGCAARYLDTEKVTDHGLTASTGKIVDGYFADDSALAETEVPPSARAASEPAAGDDGRFIGPTPRGGSAAATKKTGSEKAKKGGGPEAEQAKSEAPGAAEVRKSVRRLISTAGEGEACRVRADLWLNETVESLCQRVDLPALAGIKAKTIRSELREFLGAKGCNTLTFLGFLLSWWNDAGESAPHLGERAVVPVSIKTPSIVIAHALEAAARLTNDLGTDFAYEAFEHLEYLRPEAFSTLAEMSPTLAEMARRGWRDRDPRTMLSDADLVPVAIPGKARTS